MLTADRPPPTSFAHGGPPTRSKPPNGRGVVPSRQRQQTPSDRRPLPSGGKAPGPPRRGPPKQSDPNSFASRAARAKSAPPARPPPPGPPARPKSKEAPVARGNNPRPPPAPPKRVTQTTRPAHISPTSLLAPPTSRRPVPPLKSPTVTKSYEDEPPPSPVSTPTPKQLKKGGVSSVPPPKSMALTPTATAAVLVSPGPPMASTSLAGATGEPPKVSSSRQDQFRKLREHMDTPPSLKPGDAGPPMITESKDALKNTKTPSADIAATPIGPPSKKRLDLLRNYREHAETPPTMKEPSVTGLGGEYGNGPPVTHADIAPAKASAVASSGAVTGQRYAEELKRKETEKQAALKQVAELEHALKSAQEQAAAASSEPSPVTGGSPFKAIIDRADSQGDKAAVEWARGILEQSGGVGDTDSSMSALQGVSLFPMLGFPSSPGALTPERRRRTRVCTPHPKRSFPDIDGNDPNAPSSTFRDDEKQTATTTVIEQKYHRFFVEAAKCIPFEYTNDLAVFVVRRPYGLDTNASLFESCSYVNNENYGQRAHVSDVSTIEVVAKITADSSTLLLTGNAGVRYYNNYESQWKEYSNVDELDRPLGNIMYIDEQANEQDYSLDEVFEGAVLARNQYCSTMFSTAFGLKDRPVEESVVKRVVEPVVEYVESPRPPTSEIGVGTSDDPLPLADNGAGAKEDSQTNRPESSPPEAKGVGQQGAGGDSSDVLSFLIGQIFGGLKGLLWLILVRIPLQIITLTVVLVVCLPLISILLENENGGYGARAPATFHFNRPGTGIL